jgi:hypothetical protein
LASAGPYLGWFLTSSVQRLSRTDPRNVAQAVTFLREERFNEYQQMPPPPPRAGMI